MKSKKRPLNYYIAKWLVTRGHRDLAVRHFPEALKEYEFEKIERLMAALTEDWSNKLLKGGKDETGT